METELRGSGVPFRYRAVDIRDLDGDRLLESEDVGDNVIAILTRLRDHKGEVNIRRRQIEKRFGAIPGWADERLEARSAVELEDLSVRVLDAQSIEDLLK